MENDLITGGMLIGDAVSRYPETVPVFLEFGLHCIGCAVAASESIRDGAESHGITGKRLEEFLGALNAAARREGSGL
jgi:hybrid cluster-associated redox disulfide protein